MPEGTVRWPLDCKVVFGTTGASLWHCKSGGRWYMVWRGERCLHAISLQSHWRLLARGTRSFTSRGHRTCRAQPSPKEVRGALLQESIAAPMPWGEAEFPLAVWPVGGLGMIVSAGVVHELRGAEWRECVEKLRCGPGDMRVASCLARFANVGLALLEGLGSSLTRHPVTSEDMLELFAEEKSRVCTFHVARGTWNRIGSFDEGDLRQRTLLIMCLWHSQGSRSQGHFSCEPCSLGAQTVMLQQGSLSSEHTSRLRGVQDAGGRAILVRSPCRRASSWLRRRDKSSLDADVTVYRLSRKIPGACRYRSVWVGLFRRSPGRRQEAQC